MCSSMKKNIIIMMIISVMRFVSYFVIYAKHPHGGSRTPLSLSPRFPLPLPTWSVNIYLYFMPCTLDKWGSWGTYLHKPNNLMREGGLYINNILSKIFIIIRKEIIRLIEVPFRRASLRAHTWTHRATCGKIKGVLVSLDCFTKGQGWGGLNNRHLAPQSSWG